MFLVGSEDKSEDYKSLSYEKKEYSNMRIFLLLCYFCRMVFQEYSVEIGPYFECIKECRFSEFLTLKHKIHSKRDGMTL